MARLLVQFPGIAAVLVDGERRGETNRVIRLDPGEHVIRLDGEETSPPERQVLVEAEGDPDRVIGITFHAAPPPLDRFSPLYCRYNGFLLGQFVTVSFAEYGKAHYPVRRARMLDFLREIEVAIDLPEEPFGLGSEPHRELLRDVIAGVTERSADLAAFTLLGIYFAHYGVLARSDPDTARVILEQIEETRVSRALPELNAEALVIDERFSDVDTVLSPSLAWLTKAVDQLEVEHDTAFVIMPFAEPYASYFGTYYRPALEGVGLRTFRAWGGLSNEDYCDLLLRLIAKCGFVWADVSELNHNVLYEIGAAHAMDKLSMLVVRDDDAHAIPANIGHDTVIRYYPSSERWPREAIEAGSMFITALRLAAERGEQSRVRLDTMHAVIDSVFTRLQATIIPPEAHEAAARGRAEFEAHDFSAAERSFDDAIQLGLDDAVNRLGRGCSRVALERFSEAESDLDFVIDSDAEPSLRASAAYFRGMAREEQDRRAEAHADYAAAIALGFDDAEVLEARERTR
jgi:hypothetical protein